MKQNKGCEFMNSVTKVMSISVITNVFLSILKVIVGWICKSSALLADGVHSFSDLLTDFFAIIGNIMAKKPADEKHPYGHGRIEYLTSIGISIVILILGFSIIHNSMYSKIIVASFLVSVISIITILVKYALSTFVIHQGKKYKNSILIASGKESRADVISSLVVFFSALLSSFSNYFSILKYSDKIAGIIVGILIIRTGFFILKENVSTVIGEQEIDGEDYTKVKQILLKNKHVKTIDHLAILKYGHCYKTIIELSMDSKLSLQKSHDYVESIEQEIKTKVDRVKYITIHVNPYKELKNISLMNYSKENQSLVKKAMLEIMQNDFKKSTKQDIKIKKYIEDTLKNHVKDIKMILKDNTIIGFLNCYKENNHYLLDTIYIKEKFRNQGIGYNIIHNIIQNKKKGICLWVYKKNIKAINLYKNLGFEVTEETKTRYFMEFRVIRKNA